ncbi:50S ribosomal protein L13 [Candidatus Pacearchaeota archaeon]|nr:50S ribosomal protein L13 [Candidatus Pacearchaeota archaeon]
MTEKIIIDAEGGVMGRIAAFAAKQALFGKEVVIVNCEHAAITGSPRRIIEGYQQKRGRGGTAQRGPYFPKSPERVMKRTVRGMLSHTQFRGRAAFKRVICYDAVPAEYQASKKTSMKREIKTKSINLARLSREL